jgi:hypothetical protein
MALRRWNDNAPGMQLDPAEQRAGSAFEVTTRSPCRLRMKPAGLLAW